MKLRYKVKIFSSCVYVKFERVEKVYRFPENINVSQLPAKPLAAGI